MSNEARDPREVVLVCFAATVSETEPLPMVVREALARLDAADPRRAMWGEMVEALADARRELFDVLASCNRERIHHDGDEFHERLGGIESVLTRARALDATNQGGDDER